MRISLKWLSEYTQVPTDIKAFCDKLDLTGTGVEGVETLGASLEGVVVGNVLTCEDHPDSDHMHVVSVDVGTEEPLQIVCGAPNIAAGIKVPVACVGTVLPGDVKIKKSKLRGVVSCGMCCSQRELGLGNDHEGIWVLSEEAPVGTPIAKYLGLADTVLDLEITPNRPDCLSVVGMAREVGAMYQQDVSYPLAKDIEKLAGFTKGDPVGEAVSVEVTESVRCPRYTARVIDNVTVGPSPDWLAERVVAAGGRPINNVVDVTNYILYLYGQPLHAFDFDRIKSADGKAHVVVRPAEDGEQLVTLDGENRRLSNDMTVIATPEAAVALAGVMGGENSEVTEQTTCVLLESASFERGRTSRTSRNLGLISEASMRYERGVDDNLCEVISQAAAALLAEVSGGSVRPGVVDVYDLPTTAPDLIFRIERFNAMMGASIPQSFIVDILRRLGCAVESGDTAGVLRVTPPTFRPDLEREIDLYEEVLRLWGMDRIEPTLPGGRMRVGYRSPEQQTTAKLNNVLRASGLNETMTYSFAEPQDLERLRMRPEGLGIAVELLNPLNAEQSVMRQSIIPGLLRSVAYNQARGVKNIQLYEIGTVFFAAEGRKQAKERKRLAAVLAGAMGNPTWNNRPAPFDFFDAKGILESLARELALPKVRFRALSAEEAPHLQPGRAAEMMVDGAVVGWVGEIHPAVAADFEVTSPVAAFEVDVASLLRACRPARPYVDVPGYPAVEMDAAFVVDEAIPHEKLVQVMSSAGGKYLESVALFDVYRDEKRIGSGKKSMAYNLIFRAPDRTLTNEEVEGAFSKIVSKVEHACGAEIRS